MHFRLMSLLPFALVMHLAISFWMYSSPIVFPDSFEYNEVTGQFSYPSRNLWDRAVSENGMPIAIFLALTIVLMLLQKVIGGFIAKFVVPMKDKKNFEGLRTFSEAKEDMKEMGLVTYDAKQNPYYKNVIAQFEEIMQRPLSEEEREELNKKPEKQPSPKSKEHNKSEMEELLQKEEKIDFDPLKPSVKAKVKKKPQKHNKKTTKHLNYMASKSKIAPEPSK